MAEETIQGGTADQWAEYAKSLAVDIPEITWKDVGNVALDFTPIIGDIKGGYETVKMIGDELDKDDPNYKLIGILGGMGAVATIIGLVPGAGDFAKKAIMSGARSVADSASNLGKGALDLAQRVEVDPNTLGSFGGNIFSGKAGEKVTDTTGNRIGSLAPIDDLIESLKIKSKQMELKPIDRIQSDVGGAKFLDRDYQTPAPSGAFKDLSGRYPRNPDINATLPKNDRSRILIDRREEISSALAKKIEATGQMGLDTRYFYHTDGPIYRGARKAGLTDAEAKSYLSELSNTVAATSPRTKVEENLRNATLVMAKREQGIPFREVIGPGTLRPDGTKGISEKGYPMMTAKGGIHGGLLDDVIETGTMDVARNPKPSNFGANLLGNRSGVTVDTHAIRGTLMTLNDIEAGLVPEGFILPKFRKQYVEDPSVLTPDMIDDTLASQMTGPKGNTKKLQTEYPIFADIWHDAADKLGVSPAEAQSMGWFGFGEDTNLGSAMKTPVDVFDERLSVTAKALEISPEEAATAVFRKQIPLFGIGGAVTLGALPSEQQTLNEMDM